MKIRSSLCIATLFLLSCSKQSSPDNSSALATPTQTVDPQKTVIVTPSSPPEIEPKKPGGMGGLECAERIVLLAAKKNVALHFDNRPTSAGKCAMGVRTSLQRSRVGDVNDSLGNAIDYIHTMKPHGFVDSGLRDPRTAPVGSVIVFSGPKSADYFRTGHYGRPAGTWLGHVTIKGDDGRYYTDGRTREPAMGWVNNRNEGRIRNVAAIFVPGNGLSNQYSGKCDRLSEQEAFLSLVLAANDAHVLDYFDEKSESEGKALAQEGLAQLEHLGEKGTREEGFRQVLRLALEAGPFDDEGQLTEAVQEKISSDRALRLEYDAFLHSLPRNTGVEKCKAERLEAELARTDCLEQARASGQDAEPLAAGRCGMTFAYGACLKAKN